MSMEVEIARIPGSATEVRTESGKLREVRRDDNRKRGVVFVCIEGSCRVKDLSHTLALSLKHIHTQ